ncbi:hypothetical protein CBR_g17678 [Chara braunii]|uniref:Peroxisomal adenine nucleotide carrier 1 n=1 Tax=Chara braunii TaxID=69332 RepID=A0A388KV78_CHABU|nr:hypothetical protein CBR_g17678 [Chara braunii]|eukprot:GBG73966.1 hypothetical protein CBR_g17678 [Chara braunii]
MAVDLAALQEAVGGALGGLVSTTVLYPLDTCKTIFQAEAETGDRRKYKSTWDVFRQFLERRDLACFYRGLWTKNVQSVISQFLYFYSYNYFKRAYLRRNKEPTLGPGANLVVAAAAGVCTVIVTQPLDTAAARLQTSQSSRRTGIKAALWEQSWKEAYDGLTASLLLVSNPAVQRQKRWEDNLRRASSVAGNRQMKLPPVALSAFAAFLIGALSKTAATVVTYPMIRVKLVLQTHGKKDCDSEDRRERQAKNVKTLRDAFHLILDKEGVFGFFKGLQAQVLKTVLQAALMMMIKEKISQGTSVLLLLLQRSLRTGRRVNGNVAVPDLKKETVSSSAAFHQRVAVSVKMIPKGPKRITQGSVRSEEPQTIAIQ